MLKLISSFFLVFVLYACQEQKTNTEILNTDAINNVDNSENKSAGIDSNQPPSYLNVDLKGYQTPNINMNSLHGEVIFVNFWGSWCPPCRIEMPSIQNLYNAYRDKVKFVTIAFEKEQGKHIEYINENQYTFPVYEAVSPMESELKPGGFPTTIIINKKGEIILKEIGARDWNDAEIREMLDKLIQQ